MDKVQVLSIEYNLQWFAKDGEGGEKTEPATPKKLREARDNGQVSKSKEMGMAIELIVLFLTLRVVISGLGESLLSGFYLIYTKIPDIVAEGSVTMSGVLSGSIMNNILLLILRICAPFLILGFLSVVLVNILQIGFKITTKPMQPKLSKLNPLNGFKRIFSKDALFELAKSMGILLVMGYVAYTSLMDQKDLIFLIYDIPLMQVILMVGSIVIDIGLKISYVYLVIAFVDLIYQKRKFNEDMKMTKQEVKDEYKNIEGDPEIKGRQRARMREASQRRMMQSLPTADVVITNPTHLSVAIKYDADANKAPVVIAKGENYMAFRIREVAKENKIEIVENKPLARMLYTNVDIGAEVPPELYQAVAEVLAFVYNLKNR